MIEKEGLEKMKKHIRHAFLTLCIMLMFILGASVVSAANLPSGGKWFKNNYYYLFNNKVNWMSAKKECEKLGGQLVIIDSAKEDEFVYNYYSSNGYSDGWLGGYNKGTAQNPDWRWLDGRKMSSYTNWKPGQPDYDSSGSEAYVGYWGGSEWNNYNAQVKLPYICEWNYSFKLEKTSFTLNIGDKVYINVEKNSNNKQKITFKSNNKNIAKVSSKGMIVAKGTGVAKITVAQGSVQKAVTVIVLPSKVKEISLKSSTKDKIQLKWSSQAGVSGYEIYIYDTDIEEFDLVKTVSGNAVTIEGLDSGTKYKFKIRAYVKNGSKKYYGKYSDVYKASTK